MLDEPLLARIVAPSLTAAVGNYSDPELVAIIRYGVRSGGRIVSVMPSQGFQPAHRRRLGAHYRVFEKLAGYRRSESQHFSEPARAYRHCERQIQVGASAHRRIRAAAGGHGRGG
jgi:hypothetical protein